MCGKYVYPKEVIAEIKELFEFGLKHLPFPYEIKYIIQLQKGKFYLYSESLPEIALDDFFY